MNRKILFVDDEENVLRGFERALRSQFEIETAVGAQEGLSTVATRGPFAVVVSDLRMPVMDGIQFLAEVRKNSPDTVRLILSGNGDFDSVVASVNEGSIFQFLTKPCPPDKLRGVLGTALKQYELITAERELLEETLNGSIGMLTEVLSVVNPLAFSRASRIRTYVQHMANELKLPNRWEIDLAAMLSQIGCIAVPPEILDKVNTRLVLSKEEQDTFTAHPAIGRDLITKIPRLAVIAEIVRHQMTPLRDLRDPKISDVVAVGAQMLLVAIHFDETVSRGGSASSALKFMRDRPEIYQARLVTAIETAQVNTVKLTAKTMLLRDVRAGMIAHEDICAQNGLFLVAKGQVLSEALLARLRNFNRTVGLVEPLFVRVPEAASSGSGQFLGEQVVRR